MLPMLTIPLASTVVWPVLVNVAVPSGMAPPDQFNGSTHSVGSPPLPPTHVASTACADTTPSAVVARRTASENCPAVRELCRTPKNRVLQLAIALSIGWAMLSDRRKNLKLD